VAAWRCSSGTGGASSAPGFRLRSAPGSSHRRSVLKLARVFVKPSKALLSAHTPVVGRVTATAAGIVVRAVVSSKRASSAVSNTSVRIVANGIVVTIVTGVVHVSSSRSRPPSPPVPPSPGSQVIGGIKRAQFK